MRRLLTQKRDSKPTIEALMWGLNRQQFAERSEQMKFVIGLVVSFLVGLSCRYFDVPVGSPAVVPGALLVLAMTVGYSSTDALLNRRNRLATTSHLCGGPTGSPATQLHAKATQTLPLE